MALYLCLIFLWLSYVLWTERRRSRHTCFTKKTASEVKMNFIGNVITQFTAGLFTISTFYVSLGLLGSAFLESLIRL